MSHLYMRLPATDDDRGADSLLHDEGKHLREPSSASSGAVSLTYARLLLAFVISLVLCLTATHVLPASTDTPPPSPSLTPLAHSCPSCPSCPSPSSASASSSSCPPATPPASPSPSSSAWSWSSPVSDCPLGHVDVFVVLQRAELLLTSHLVRSLELFMPCYGYLHLFCDEDVERDMHAWVTVHERVRFHRLLDPRAGEDVAAVQHLIGYVLQQWVMLWADRLVEPSAEYVLFFDTDSIAGLPITCSSLFDEHGRVYMPYWTTPKQPEYYPSCKELVHNECARSFMAFLPLLFPVRMFEPFRQHLQMRMRTVSMLPNTSFNAMLAAWFNHSGWHTFSQFNLMGNYQFHFQPDSIHPLHYLEWDEHPTGEVREYMPPGLHYGWIPCRFLGSCPPGVNAEMYRGSMLSNYSSKYGVLAMQLIQQVLHQGYCLSTFARGMKREGLTWSAGLAEERPELLPATCDRRDVNSVHPLVPPYGQNQPSMEQVYARYTPMTIPGPMCFARS